MLTSDRYPDHAGGADGGPRAVLSSAVRSTKSLPKDERRRKIVATVDQLRAKFK